MAKSKIVFMCKECGRESARWLGRCPACNAWNAFVEQTVSAAPSPRAVGPISAAQELSRIETRAEERWELPLNELNRVLGGGLVPGSVVLIGGEPGIGKSTLLLQVAARLSERVGSVLYVSAEESARQVRMRADRLDVSAPGLFLLPETALE